MPYVSKSYRNTDRWPFIEYSKPVYEWEDDEFEDKKWGTIAERQKWLRDNNGYPSSNNRMLQCENAELPDARHEGAAAL
jgi:hypothetical protein